ncbi:MAG: hypothetical protein KDC10_11720 [Calditrichaeota bacterium]|nr:hypothetical protein [Candidatus Cloacimonadota bacterium]MCB1047855.1 hypothetical protein [Calditrichota bacterium]MCB9473766.1 hypothetical protein [Candidatus Delongbacteria bacterium]
MNFLARFRRRPTECGRLLFFIGILLLAACSGSPGPNRQYSSLGFSLPLPDSYQPTVFIDPQSDSTGTVVFLQGESPSLVSLSVWVQTRELPLEEYVQQVTWPQQGRRVIDMQDPVPFTPMNAPAGLHGRLHYAIDLPENGSLLFWEDSWVVPLGERFFSFFWTVPDSSFAQMDSVILPIMQGLRFGE